MKEIIKLLKKNRSLTALLFFSFFWIVFLSSSGTLTSGYHFTDDHEILTIDENMNNIGFFETSKALILDDLDVRFRPFYYVNRIVEAKLFKTNILAWSLYSAALAILTFHCLFLFLYRQGFKFGNAILFPFLCLIGSQSTIWWRLGPAESIGVFTISVSLFFLANSIYRKKKKHLIISLVFLLFSSLSKESFFVLLPSYGLILLLLNYQFNHGRFSLIEVLRHNIRVILFLFLVFIIEAIIIVVIGTNNMGYAGIDNSFVLTHFVYWVCINLIENQYVYLILVGLFLLLQNIVFSTISVKKDGKKVTPFILHLGILILIVFPQYLMHFKSGLGGRYFIPINIGFAYTLIFVLDRVTKDSSISLITKRLFLIIVLLVNCTWLVNKAVPLAKSHTKAGVSTKVFLSSISKNTQSTDSILIVVNSYENYELCSSLIKYLRIKEDNRNASILIQNEEIIETSFHRLLHRDFKKKFETVIVSDISYSYPCVIVAPSSSNTEIINKLNLNVNYSINALGEFIVFYKK